MQDQNEIVDQLDLLKTHRRTLAHLLQQQAMLGKSFAPPGVSHGILEARESIHRIKVTLRQRDVQVEDQPNDEEAPTAKSKVIPKRKNIIFCLVLLFCLVSIAFVAVPGTLTPACFLQETYIANQKTTLRGTLELAQVADATVPGASGNYYYLILDEAICIKPDDEARQFAPGAFVRHMDEIQVMPNRVEFTLSENNYVVPDFGKSIGRTAVIFGQLMPSHTAHHRTPYILFADTIEVR